MISAQITTIDGSYLMDPYDTTAGPLRNNDFQTTFTSIFLEMTWAVPINDCLLETAQYQTYAKTS